MFNKMILALILAISLDPVNPLLVKEDDANENVDGHLNHEQK